MHIAPNETATERQEALAAELRRKLQRAEDRAQFLESDASWEANRQIIIWLRDELEWLSRRRAV